MTDFRRITTDGSFRVTTDGVQRVIIGAVLPPTPPVGPGTDTLLTITGFGALLYQARGLTQSLEVIKAANSQERDIEGALIDISGKQFRKYVSVVTCTDQTAPPIDNLFPGMRVTVECACPLCYLTGNPGSPARPEVSGSSYVEGDYTFYRPVLTMLIRDVKLSFDEWKADIQWQIFLEEV